MKKQHCYTNKKKKSDNQWRQLVNDRRPVPQNSSMGFDQTEIQDIVNLSQDMDVSNISDFIFNSPMSKFITAKKKNSKKDKLLSRNKQRTMVAELGDIQYEEIENHSLIIENEYLNDQLFLEHRIFHRKNDKSTQDISTINFIKSGFMMDGQYVSNQELSIDSICPNQDENELVPDISKSLLDMSEEELTSSLSSLSVSNQSIELFPSSKKTSMISSETTFNNKPSSTPKSGIPDNPFTFDALSNIKCVPNSLLNDGSEEELDSFSEAELHDLHLSSESLSQEISKSEEDTSTPNICKQTPMDELLSICKQKKLILFSDAYKWKSLKVCHKIGSGCYGEVYSLTFNGSGDETVLKIISIEGTGSEQDCNIEKIITELRVMNALNKLRYSSKNRTENYIKLKRLKCVSGRMPGILCSAWNDYEKSHDSGGVSKDPTLYSRSQIYVLIETPFGGTTIEDFEFKSAMEAMSVFNQVASSLAIAEEELSFEHRDLHIGNILVLRTDMESLSYRFQGKQYLLPTSNIFVTIIDFTFSRYTDKNGVFFVDLDQDSDIFKGEGEYQFEIYRQCRICVLDSWSEFIPYTNILWLHYLVDFLLQLKSVTTSEADGQEIAITILKKVEETVRGHDTASHFLKEFEFWEL